MVSLPIHREARRRLREAQRAETEALNAVTRARWTGQVSPARRNCSVKMPRSSGGWSAPRADRATKGRRRPRRQELL